jgi:hypothetical protein
VKLHRRRTVLLVALAVLAVAAPAAASHVFRDVPSTNAHHAAIAELSGAGVTAGCRDDAYCPGQAVTRAQMASFLQRGATRVNADQSSTTLAIGPDGSASGVPVTVEVALAGAAGGTANLALQGTVTVTGGGPGACPCEVEAFIYRAGDDAQGPSTWASLERSEGSVALPVGWGLTVPSNARGEYRIAVFVTGLGDPGAARADGALTAVSGPFGTTRP